MPAARPSGPRCTRRRKTFKRDSCDRAPKAFNTACISIFGISVFCLSVLRLSMFVQLSKYSDYVNTPIITRR